MSDEVPTVESLARKLEAAKARIGTLAEQLALAERVQSGLRSRIAALEHQIEMSQANGVEPVIDLGRFVQPAPQQASPIATNGEVKANGQAPTEPVHLDYAFGDHEDDLLPRT